MDDSLRIEAGKLRERISFYTTAATQDEAGGFPESTKTFAFSVACMLAPKISMRTYEGQKTEFTETWDLLMRYDSNLVPDGQMLAFFRNEYFNILGIENVLTRNLVLKIKIARH